MSPTAAQTPDLDAKLDDGSTPLFEPFRRAEGYPLSSIISASVRLLFCFFMLHRVGWDGTGENRFEDDIIIHPYSPREASLHCDKKLDIIQRLLFVPPTIIPPL